MDTRIEHELRVLRGHALLAIRAAKTPTLARPALLTFEEGIRRLGSWAAVPPRLDTHAPAWFRDDLLTRELAAAERRLVEAALALDGAAGTEVALEAIVQEHNEACQLVRRLRIRWARAHEVEA